MALDDVFGIVSPAAGGAHALSRTLVAGGLPRTVVVGDHRVLASAVDATSGVARVDFIVDGTLRATRTSAPFEWVWAAGMERLGEHVLAVRVVDQAGNEATASRSVTTVPTSLRGILETLP